MPSTFSRAHLALIIGALPLDAAALAAEASAEMEAAPAAEEDAAPDPNAIVVTARRRGEEVQDVPISIAVLDARQLDATGTYNVQRLTQLQPSVQYYASNPRNSAINIRGLGAPFGLTNDGIEQGVGLYIDQVYYSRPAASSFDFIDIEQIEVLRGPQGTLYGKNTTAGAISITTRKPSFRTEGRFEASAGNLDFFQFKGSLSGALGEKLAGRIALSRTVRQGTLRNVLTGQDLNEQDNIGLRGALLWTAREGLDVTLRADWSRQNPDCCGQVYASVAPTLRAANRQFEGLAAAAGYAPPSRNAFDRLIDNDSPLRAEQDFGGASLMIELDTGLGQLTSVSAWRSWSWNPSNDRDFIGLPITTVSANPSEQRQLTQEVRLASSGENRLDFVVGLFAYRQVIDSVGQQEQGRLAALWLLGPAQAGNAAVLDGYRQDTRIHFENNSFAGFGRLTWRLSDTLTLEPGLRLNYDTKQAQYSAVVSGGIANPTPAQIAIQRGVLSPQAYDVDFKDFNVSGDFNIAWKPIENLLLYGVYSRTFKPGGVNLSGLPADAAGIPIQAAATVDPENVQSYEVGLKSDLYGLRFNLAAFTTRINDYQATVVNNQVGVLRGYLSNAEKVRVRGVEVEVAANPADWLSLYANAAFTDAKYVDFRDAPCAIEFTGGPQVCDISGGELPGVSRWTAAFGGEASQSGLGGTVYLGLDGSYRSSFSSNPSPSPFVRIDGYALVSLRAGWRNDAGWNAFAWVRNLADTEYFDFLSTQPGGSGLIVGQPGDPRTWGVTIGKRWR
jgi:iron complex outermembrane receptor protein